MSKPVWKLTKVLACDGYEPNFYGETMMARGSIIHAAIESELREKLSSNDVRVEYELTLDRGFYVLVGHPDIIDVTEKVVYEIKPMTLRDVYALQLSAYIEMAEMAEIVFSGSWNGKFVLYDKEMHYIIQDFYPMHGVLTKIDDVVKAKILAHESGRLVLRKGFCNFCRRRIRCPLADLQVKWMVVYNGK